MIYRMLKALQFAKLGSRSADLHCIYTQSTTHSLSQQEYDSQGSLESWQFPLCVACVCGHPILVKPKAITN